MIDLQSAGQRSSIPRECHLGVMLCQQQRREGATCLHDARVDDRSTDAVAMCRGVISRRRR
jgi:hypothetical protein